MVPGLLTVTMGRVSRSRDDFPLSLGTCSTHEVRLARIWGLVVGEREGARVLALLMILGGAVMLFDVSVA